MLHAQLYRSGALVARFVSLAVCTVATAFGGDALEVGVARVDLTPPPEMKASLGGYGKRESKPATGVHDSVWAKALVLSRET